MMNMAVAGTGGARGTMSTLRSMRPSTSGAVRKVQLARRHHQRLRRRWENMAGRVVQFTRNRVEKRLDTCPWDIVGSRLLAAATVYSRRASTSRPQGHRGEFGAQHVRPEAAATSTAASSRKRYATCIPAFPSRDGSTTCSSPSTPSTTPCRAYGQEGQCLRNGQYTQNFGEETSRKGVPLGRADGLVWSIQFPMMAIGTWPPMKTSSCACSVSSLRLPARTSSSIRSPKRACAATSACHTRWTRTTAGSSADISAICSTCSRCRMRWCAGRRTRTWIKVKSEGLHCTL